MYHNQTAVSEHWLHHQSEKKKKTGLSGNKHEPWLSGNLTSVTAAGLTQAKNNMDVQFTGGKTLKQM